MADKILGKHYNYSYNGMRLDPYRILDIYGITHPAHQHAVKKLLVPGNRGAKALEQDIQEAILSLERWLEMIKEDLDLGLRTNPLDTIESLDPAKDYWDWVSDNAKEHEKQKMDQNSIFDIG